MKRILSFIAFACVAISTYAQYTESNSIIRQALVSYNKGIDGYYNKTSNILLDRVDNIVSYYAYDAKAQNLYMETENSNCVVTLSKDCAKVIKKNKLIPQFKGDAVNPEIEKVNARLEQKFKYLNALRSQHIADSIAKAKADSVAKAKSDSVKFAKIAKEKENYRKAHKWLWVPINSKTKLTCSLCNETISYQDSILCAAVKNDTIYHLDVKELALEHTYFKVHKYPIPISLRDHNAFRYHCDVYSDSLQKDKPLICGNIELFNDISYEKALDEVKKDAPYGFFDEWGWDSEYSLLTFHFKYVNTNTKTIKYIDVYFVVTNDVGDVRKTGSFKATGPLAEGKFGTWEWDDSPYYVSGDSSNMEITKVILTYMDGTKKILNKNMLRFN